MEKQTTILDILSEKKRDSKSVSEDDPLRKEMLWESRSEDVIFNIKDECIEISKKHGKKARLLKKLYVSFSLPSIIIPLILSGLQDVLKDHIELKSGLLIATGILVGVNSFVNFGRLCERHFQYENLYFSFCNDINIELSKPKRHRIAADIYLEKTRSKYNYLNMSAPTL